VFVKWKDDGLTKEEMHPIRLSDAFFWQSYHDKYFKSSPLHQLCFKLTLYVRVQPPGAHSTLGRTSFGEYSPAFT